MGKRRESREPNNKRREGSFPSPSSSSSSEFEFTVSLSPSSRRSSSNLCPADELFYKGQLLPLHLSPRISMVRTLLLASSSASSSSTNTNTAASRDSIGSSSSSSSSLSIINPAELLPFHPECDSSRPSSVTEEEALRVISSATATKRNKYFSSFANRFSSVFLSRGGSKKDLDFEIPSAPPTTKRTNSSAKQAIKRYVKKVKPLYEKLSPAQNKNQSQNQIQNQNQNHKKKKTFSFSIRKQRGMTLISDCNIVESMKKLDDDEDREMYPHSHFFSGNLRFAQRKRCVGSCPSSMRSSPTHSGLLCIGGSGGAVGGFPTNNPSLMSSTSSSSSMEELQSAIQGAIAHCKSTMIQSNQKNVSCIH